MDSSYSCDRLTHQVHAPRSLSFPDTHTAAAPDPDHAAGFSLQEAIWTHAHAPTYVSHFLAAGLRLQNNDIEPGQRQARQQLELFINPPILSTPSGDSSGRFDWMTAHETAGCMCVACVTKRFNRDNR